MLEFLPLQGQLQESSRRLVLRFMQQRVFTGLLRGTIEMDEALFTPRAGPGPRGSR